MGKTKMKAKLSNLRKDFVDGDIQWMIYVLSQCALVYIKRTLPPCLLIGSLASKIR